jgi:transcriptional regulator with XRE-family HTH domain
MNSVDIGLFIMQLRKEKGLTQQELAIKIGVSDKTISKWEGGHGFPDITLFQDIAKVFDVTVDELMDGRRKVNLDNYSILEKAVMGGIETLNKLLERKIDLRRSDEYNNNLLFYVLKYESMVGLQFLLDQKVLINENKQLVWTPYDKLRPVNLPHEKIYGILFDSGKTELLESLDYFESASQYSPVHYEMNSLLDDNYEFTDLLQKVISSKKAPGLLHLAALQNKPMAFERILDLIIANNLNYDEKDAFQYISNATVKSGDIIRTMINNKIHECTVSNRTHYGEKILSISIYSDSAGMMKDYYINGDGRYGLRLRDYDLKKQIKFKHEILDISLPYILQNFEKKLIKKVLYFQKFFMTLKLATVMEKNNLEWISKSLDWTKLSDKDKAMIARMKNKELTSNLSILAVNINDLIAVNDLDNVTKMIEIYKNHDEQFKKLLKKYIMDEINSAEELSFSELINTFYLPRTISQDQKETFPQFIQFMSHIKKSSDNDNLKDNFNKDELFQKAVNWFVSRKYTYRAKQYEVDVKALLLNGNLEMIHLVVGQLLEDWEKDQIINDYTEGNLQIIKALLDSGSCFSTLRPKEFYDEDYGRGFTPNSPKVMFENWLKKYSPRKEVWSDSQYQPWRLVDNDYIEFLKLYRMTRDMTKTNLMKETLKAI